jgi:molecular chaperone GrpE
MRSSHGSEENENQEQVSAPEDGQVATEPERDLEAELARMEDRYKRALADLDNYRKRALRETERRVDESRAAQLREWLEVVDSLERALFMQPEDPVAEGLRAVLEQMEAVLARQGVVRMAGAGEPFDPELHEAVGIRHTDDVPDRSVAEVARSGYTLGDRVLRPAEVVVARVPEESG